MQERDRNAERAAWKKTNAYRERQEFIYRLITGGIVLIGFSAAVWVPCFVVAIVDMIVGM